MIQFAEQDWEDPVERISNFDSLRGDFDRTALPYDFATQGLTDTFSTLNTYLHSCCLSESNFCPFLISKFAG